MSAATAIRSMGDQASRPHADTPAGFDPAKTGAGSREGIRPFLVGTAVGGVAGAVAGTLLSQQTRRLLIGLIHLVGRRLTDAERDQLRFELLLQ